MSPGTEVTNDGRLRLLFLLVILVALGAFAVTQRPWVVGSNGGSAVAAPTDCPGAAAPALRTVDLQGLNRLRQSITAEAVFGAELHSYEEGFVGTAAAFSDQEPTMQPISTSDQGVEAGYEIRWWTPSRHDVVADSLGLRGCRRRRRVRRPGDQLALPDGGAGEDGPGP